MNDEELNKLFENDSSEQKEALDETTNVVAPEHLAPKLTDSVKEEDFIDTTKVKEQAERTESLKQVKSFFKSIDLSKLKKAFERKPSETGKTKTQNNGVYLEKFPLSFRGTLLVLLILSFVLLIADIFFLPFFHVSKIEITGNYVITEDEICDMTDIHMDDHLLAGISGDILDVICLDYGKVEDRIKAENPYIEDIQISVNFPSEVSITVTERAKVACVKMPDGYAAIDMNGVVLEYNTFGTDEAINPVICGLDVVSAVIGEPIILNDTVDYNRSIIVLGAVLAADINGGDDDYSMFANLQEIRIVPGGSIFLTFILPSGSSLQVKLEAIDNINDDMNWLIYAIEENAFDGLPDGALDMTGDEYIYREY